MNASFVARRDCKREAREKLWGDAFWTPSFFAASTGGAPIDTLKLYVQSQQTKAALKGRGFHPAILMKIRTVEIGKDKKMGVVWCMGCGAFHGFPAELWNGDEDNPSTTQPITVKRGDEQVCVFTVKDGVIGWDTTSTHRLAGGSRPLPHEATWSVHGPEQPKQPNMPTAPKEVSTP
jgi:hypothetical protein